MHEASVEQDRPLLKSLAGPEVESSIREKKIDLLFIKPAGLLIFLRRPFALDCKSAQVLNCVVGQEECLSDDRESPVSLSLR